MKADGLRRAVLHPRFRGLVYIAAGQMTVTWVNARGERKSETGALDYVIPLLLDRMDSADLLIAGQAAKLSGGRR